MQDGRIYIELVNAPLLKMGGSGDEFRAAIDLADERGWIELHESDTFIRLTQMGSDPFATWGDPYGWPNSVSGRLEGNPNLSLCPPDATTLNRIGLLDD